MTAGRLRSRELVKPFRGMRIERSSDSTESRLRAFALHRGVDFAFSHTTAAELYGVPLPAHRRGELHVSVPGSCRAPIVNGFVGHKLHRWATVDLRGFPVTSPEQTWLDLAIDLPHSDLVIAGDHVVGGRDPLTNVAALREAISASAGRRGIGRARAALARVRIGSESPGETRLRLLLEDAGLPLPLLNLDVHDRSGAFVARVDLAYAAERIALEYEGDIHRTDQATWRKDIARRERVEDLGWRVVRVTADDIAAPLPLAARIRHLLRTRQSLY